MKRALSLIITAVILLSSLVLALAVDNDLYVGDVNGDGAIDQYDYILVKRHYFGTRILKGDETVRADVNYDGSVNQYDYILIKRHYFGTYEIEQRGGDTSGGDTSGDESWGDSDVPITVQVPNIVSAGKRYTTSPAADLQYEDTYTSELTDGIYAKSTGYGSSVFSGYNSNFEVVVDLEDDGVDLNLFEVSCLSTSDAGIDLPQSITVYSSDNKSSWTNLGNMTIPDFREGKVLLATLELSEDITCRYVKFSFTRKAAWVFIDEIIVHSSIPKYQETYIGKLQGAYRATHANDATLQSNIDSVASGKTLDASLGSALASYECDYEITCNEYDWRTDENYGCLTDGNTPGSAFEREVWVGMSHTGGASIIIDLGRVRDDVYSFSAHAFNREISNILLPMYLDVSVSIDGDRYVNIGRSYAADTEQENYGYYLVLDRCINARYVRFSVPAGEGYFWLEEAAVYANAASDKAMRGMYGDFDFETTANPSYWSSGSDYDITQNLIIGKTQQIVSDSFIEYATGERDNTVESTVLLTDGKKTQDDYCYGGDWVHFVSGGGRTVYYDFGHISSVESFSIRFLELEDWGILLPGTLRLALSEDGINWYLAGDASPQSEGKVFNELTFELDQSYRARYAAVYMNIQNHVFLDEISIFGKKNVSDSSALTSLNDYKINKGEYDVVGFAAPSDELLGGVEDVCLIYFNYADTNEEFFKPYVGYTDKDGNVIDTMFDGYLFLPSTAALPSGGHPYGTNYASDWNSLFDEMFTSGINFDALNKTAETTKKTLGLEELKLKVYVTIPHMDDTLYNFGDIDFDGYNDSLTTIEGRVRVARVYAERVINKFNSMGYANLELCGFYWFHEEISGTDVNTAIEVNKMFDDLGYQLFWIPYYQANGFSRWEEFGFDVCCYQPNYAFSINVDKSRIAYAVNSALTYGMCIEMEIDSSAFGDPRFFQKYMDYLHGGVEYGYMNGAIHMYYQGLDDFGKSSRSDDDKIRLIYEYTHDFMKGTLDPVPDVAAPVYAEGNMNSLVLGTLNPEESEINLYKLSGSPAHGTVSITENGEFVYYPNKGFSGTDTFTYRISNYLGWSEECTVYVEVND
ncbi:MAG: DUF4855 domain-containing protein [Clostridia bacterium]|nr:DUF4855 domain-containing protein [Clostridia bacterium]